MKTIVPIFLWCLLSCSILFAQTPIQKKISVQQGQNLFIEVHHANLHIHANAQSNEVEIKGVAKINNGENDDAFHLEVKEQGGDIYLLSEVKNYNRLPHMMKYFKDGKEYYEKIDRDEEDGWTGMKVINNKNGKGIQYGVIVEIELHITVPQNIVLDITSVYGKVTLDHFGGPLNVDNTYGPIDAIFSKIYPDKKTQLKSTYSYVDISLPKTVKTNVKLSSSYGEIFTNLDIEIDQDSRGLTAHAASTIRGMLNGGGPKLNVEATYNNIYLREVDN